MSSSNTSFYEFDNPTVINNTTQSVSSSTGSFITLGGIGIAKNAFIGGNLASTGTTTGSQLISTVSTGTSPLVITSTSVVSNLNANFLSGATFTSPGAIGGTTASTGAFTSITLTTPLAVLSGGSGTTTSTGTGNLVLSNTPTFVTPVLGAATGTSLSVSSQLISTVATGTAPLQVASTTNVLNLNASTLSGATFASPGAIGGTTPALGNFTLIGATTSNPSVTLNNNSGTGGSLQLGVASSVNIFLSNSLVGQSVINYANSLILGVTNSAAAVRINASGTDSTTTITGTQVITGGLGVSGNVTIGGKLTTGNPILYVYQNSNFTPSGYNADYPFTFNTVLVDNISGYNTGNGAYSPSVAGYYMVTSWATRGLV
jgi:hypothetical protein